jgi:transposase
MNLIKQTKYNYFVGIDVSRNKLDIAVRNESQHLFHRVIVNCKENIIGFIKELKGLPKFKTTNCIFCLEHTGYYSNHLLQYLAKIKAHVLLDDPRRMRFSFGIVRGKYDKIDAIRISDYAYLRRENFIKWLPKRPILNQLASLMTIRSRLVDLQTGLKTPLKEQQSFISKAIQKESLLICGDSILAVKKDIIRVDNAISALIESDPQLKRYHEIITSIPNVGKNTSIHIILTTNEFKTINCPKKFACFAGVAPFANESGTIKRTRRVSHMANKKVKALLHLCAIGALRNVPEIRAYYLRKTEEGKPAMLVINAIRFKLILRIFACIKQDRCYIDKNEFTSLSTKNIETVPDESPV